MINIYSAIVSSLVGGLIASTVYRICKGVVRKRARARIDNQFDAYIESRTRVLEKFNKDIRKNFHECTPEEFTRWLDGLKKEVTYGS